MNVGEMYKTLKKEIVLGELINEYPEEKKNLLGYNDAWNEILKCSPEKSDYVCRVKYFKDEDIGKFYFDVCGYVNDEDHTYAIEYLPWEDWLSMEVKLINESEREISKELILAAILFEMTWAGYSQKDVQERKDVIDERLKEVLEVIKNPKVIFEDKEKF